MWRNTVASNPCNQLSAFSPLCYHPLSKCNAAHLMYLGSPNWPSFNPDHWQAIGAWSVSQKVCHGPQAPQKGHRKSRAVNGLKKFVEKKPWDFWESGTQAQMVWLWQLADVCTQPGGPAGASESRPHSWIGFLVGQYTGPLRKRTLPSTMTTALVRQHYISTWILLEAIYTWHVIIHYNVNSFNLDNLLVGAWDFTIFGLKNC